MKLGVLFSGGKDPPSPAGRQCSRGGTAWITVVSGNPESYMFHTPNIRLTALQAEAARASPCGSRDGRGKEEDL
jgi:diphthamide synthase (EF-2-diphthine--ammonia ligase)